MAGLLNKAKQALAGDDTYNEHHNLNTAAPRGEPTIGRSEPLHGGLTNSGIHNNTSSYENNIRGRDTLGTQHNTLGSGGNLGGSSLGGNNYGSSTVTDTAGPHNSNVANKLDPRVDSDRDGRAGGLGSGTSGLGSQHQPGATSAYGSTTAGPHNSNIANKLDPRVDSDRDGRGAISGTSHGLGGTTHGSTTGGPLSSSTHGTHGSTNAGPHNSNIANKLDPRVDSDRDGRGNHGTAHSTTNLHHSVTGQPIPSTHAHNAYDSQANNGPHDSTSRGTLSSSGGIYNPHGTTAAAALGVGAHNINSAHNTSTNAGPHNSNVANKLDPRVDSDRDGRGALGGNTTGGLGNTTHGAYNNNTTAGPHNSNAANKLDPRVDSDRDGRGLGGNTVGGFGTTHNITTGPHNSNVANKLDPRVDSDRDGRGLGGTTAGGLGSGSHGTHHNTRGGVMPGAYDSSATAGPHNSNVANKLDPRVDSDRDGRGLGGNTVGGFGTTHDTHHNTTSGPHNSNVANKLDPRVDSDRDGRGLGGNTAGGIGGQTHGTLHDNTAFNAGAHNSKVGHGINSSATALGAGPGGLGLGQNTYGTHGTHGTHTAGAGTGGLGNNINSTNNGPHSSNLANKLDPRVDSDRDGRGNHHGTDYPQKYEPLVTSIPGTHTNPPGAPLTKIPRTTGLDSGVNHGTTSGLNTDNNNHGTTSGLGHNNNHGTTSGLGHNNNQGITSGLGQNNTHGATSGPNIHNNNHGANTSTLGNTHGTSGVHNNRSGAATGTHGASGTHTGSGAHGSNLPGPAPNTAGPHSKDILNKLDPRVDSNLDGSKTIGGGSGPA